jgi:branched-chain amino acid transport system ATP-binding protein
MNALEITSLRSGYTRVDAVSDVSLTVPEGAWVAVLGANGAGKTTLLRTISGLLPARSGRVSLAGTEVTGHDTERRAALGLGHVPENRLIFPGLTVNENLVIGGYLIRRRPMLLAERLDRVHALFPRLADRRRQAAGTLSGGEQQMLAVGRALMAGPSVLMLDEPSIGLAPKISVEIFTALAELRAAGGLSVLLVEQNAALALAFADTAYVLDQGVVSLHGPAARLRQDPRVRAAYLGAPAGESMDP